MNIWIVLFLITIAILLSLSYFLASELLKKFGFMKKFIEHSGELVEWNYYGEKEPDMYNIVLKSKNEFCALIAFDLGISIINYKGVDYYGYLESKKSETSEMYEVVFATYLGKGHANFKFLINNNTKENPVIISFETEEKKLKPSAVFKPHWYQKLGFYG